MCILTHYHYRDVYIQYVLKKHVILTDDGSRGDLYGPMISSYRCSFWTHFNLSVVSGPNTNIMFYLAFTATSDEVFIVPSEAGMNGVEALGHPLVLPHQHPVLQVP